MFITKQNKQLMLETLYHESNPLVVKMKSEKN